MASEEQIQCMKLLDVLGRIINANKGTATESEWYAEGLANKFYDHAFFVLKISGGATSLTLPPGTIAISGISSVDVLLRAAFEAFLTFYYVFSIPETPEDKDFKYWSYRLAGAMDRKDFPATTEEQKATLANDKQVIQKLSERLQSNSSFQSLGEKTRKRILNGTWRLQPWTKIAEEASLVGLLAPYVYCHLCGVAHSSSLSVLQTKLAYEKHEESVLMEPAVSLINNFIANMVHYYCELFSSSKAALEKDKAGMKLVEMWVAIGRG